MVQRKLPDKFGIRSEPVKGEKRVTSFKQISCIQYPDVKNRGADLTKKMKKSSRPIKLSDFESLTPSPIGKNVAQPGKPPPQKQQPMIRTPNYMKSTSCFNARREVSQVSSRNIHLSNDDKNTSKRSLGNSAHGSGSGRKPTKCLTKSSSFKRVRTLTKTPSFKAIRGGLKKSSRVAVCADMNTQRATCSSTLKDSKFPPFLLLSPGGTESEGISAMKVCPYTYCSLNGHRHAPLPPLKCFLSARRRLLKTQKSFKSGVLSPRKVEPSGNGKMASEDLGSSESSPLDFFIEVYAENKEAADESIGEGILNDDGAGLTSLNRDDEVAEHNEDGKQFQENISDEFLGSEVDLGEEIAEGSFFHGNDDNDDSGSTDTEMEDWEEQQFFDDLDKLEDVSEETHRQNGELFGSGDIITFTGEVDKGFSAETGDFEEQFCVGDSKLHRHQDREVEESSQVSESLSYDQLSYADDAFDDMDFTVEKAEKEYEELIVNSELESEFSEIHSVTQVKEEAPRTENQDLEVDGRLEVSDGECAKTNEGCDQKEALQFDNEFPDYDLVLQEETSNVEEQDHLSEQDETDSSIVLEALELKADEEDTANLSVKTEKQSRAATGSSQEPPHSGKNWPWNIICKKLEDEPEDSMNFNPREPNYLPLVTDPEAEKVDLKHQLMDDRKNAEDWMLDFALQRTVTQLAPARKKKVALLVEAFESVMPTSKCETHLRNTSGAFTQAKPIQACF